MAVKHDECTHPLYGGNKVRKLEYLLRRALDRGARRVATFGAAGSNHALATALHARELDLRCTCFLAHQRPTPNVPKTLSKHAEIGTELVRYGGSVDKLSLFRRYLHGRKAWVIPLGGSCWFSTLGFVNAALELSAQIDAGAVNSPRRIYIANGTMGSASGLALGMALAGLDTEIHAVRVATNRYVKPDVMQRLMNKTATLMHRLDDTVPPDLARRTRVVWRDGFYAGGYAAVDAATQRAVDFAAAELGLSLDTTYTGKAMAAALQDAATHCEPCLFWNTYSPAPRGTGVLQATMFLREFQRYFETTR